MKIKLLAYIGMAGLLSASFASCIKNNIKDLGTAGTPRVRIDEAPDHIQYFSPFEEDRTVDLLTIRRDEVSEADVNKTVTVTLVNEPDSIDVYNDANGSSFEPFPDSLYTVVNNGVTKSGDNFTLTFEPGVTAITVSVIIHGSKWDLSHTYGFYLKLADAAGKEIYPDKGEALAAVAVKNKWDGVYEVTGTMTDFTTTTLQHVNVWLSENGYDNETYELRTAGPTTCYVFDPVVYGDYIVPITSGTNLSGYGSFGLVLEFDPATDQIISLTNYYGQGASANKRSALLDPSGINAYDEASKTISIKYFMKQEANLSPAPPDNIRTAWDETWTYIGSR